MCKAAHCLRASQKQKAVGIKAVVKKGQELFLHFRCEIDKQVAAAQDIQLGKGWVHDNILRGEDNHVPYGLGNLVTTVHLDEIPAQALRRHIRRDVGRKNRLPGFVNSSTVQVGSKDLQ
jgi:hypothetical protein